MTKIKKLFLITLLILLVGSMGALAQTSDTSFSGGIDEVIATIDKNNLDKTEKEGVLEITFVHLIDSLTETSLLIRQNF